MSYSSRRNDSSRRTTSRTEAEPDHPAVPATKRSKRNPTNVISPSSEVVASPSADEPFIDNTILNPTPSFISYPNIASSHTTIDDEQTHQSPSVPLSFDSATGNGTGNGRHHGPTSSPHGSQTKPVIVDDDESEDDLLVHESTRTLPPFTISDPMPTTTYEAASSTSSPDDVTRAPSSTQSRTGTQTPTPSSTTHPDPNDPTATMLTIHDDEPDQNGNEEEEGEESDEPASKGKYACKPCKLIENVSKVPLRILRVNIQKQYTLNKNETNWMSSSERERLVSAPVRVMGTASRDNMYFVAKDVCLLIHTRRGNVAKSIGQVRTDKTLHVSAIALSTECTGCYMLCRAW